MIMKFVPFDVTVFPDRLRASSLHPTVFMTSFALKLSLIPVPSIFVLLAFAVNFALPVQAFWITAETTM